MSDELHIASFIVQVRPDAVAEVAAATQALPGAEIAARDGGKLILLAEAAACRDVMSIVDRLREVPGVLAVNLVYHHAEARALMNEEIPDGHTA